MCTYIRLMASRVGDFFEHASRGCTGTAMLGNGTVDPTLPLSLSLSLYNDAAAWPERNSPRCANTEGLLLMSHLTHWNR